MLISIARGGGKKNPTRMGFEPTRAEHNGLAVHRLNHSATSSSTQEILQISLLLLKRNSTIADCPTQKLQLANFFWSNKVSSCRRTQFCRDKFEVKYVTFGA